MPFSYANPGSGPSAGGVGWFDFGELVLTPGQVITGLSGTLANGIHVTFDLTYASLEGTPRNVIAVPAPQPLSYFGLTGYTGLIGNVVLIQDIGSSNHFCSVTFDNIEVKDALGNPMSNYAVVVADGETTSGISGFEEGLSFTSNGGNWTQLAALGTTNPPTIVGGDTFIGFVGVSKAPNTAYVYYSQKATSVMASMQGATGLQRTGFSIGFAVTQVQLYQTVTHRLDVEDRFALRIEGTPSDTIHTTGVATDLQAEYATIAAVPGTTYTLDQAMATGSNNTINDYTQTVSAINLTVGGSVPSVGALPETITPALGDIIQYTITNVAEQRYKKTASKRFAKPGDTIKYTVTVDNPSNIPLSNVLVTDVLPTGTTYIGNLNVSAPYTGTNPMSGITITTIAPNGIVTLSWDVKVAETLPVQNPITNVAKVSVPEGTTGTTNVTLTQVNQANLSSPGTVIKSASPSAAQPGDTITYTISLTNTGNVSANNVVIIDPIPAGTSYVANSLTGNVAFTGNPTKNIQLTSSLPAGATAIFTYQLLVANAIPAINPIQNTARVAYDYTVDPTVPNGASGIGKSNTVSVPIHQATLISAKKVDKSIAYLCDKLTYTITLKNIGNVSANNVVIKDTIPCGTTFIPGSLVVSAPYTGDICTEITLSNPIQANECVCITFKVRITCPPTPNPMQNCVTTTYMFTVDPEDPDGMSGTSTATSGSTTVFAYNFQQQINDLIESIALEEAALAAITNAEGAKIQKMVAMQNITTQKLLCLNKSVADLMDSIALLESILKKKLNIVNCQVTGNDGC